MPGRTINEQFAPYGVSAISNKDNTSVVASTFGGLTVGDAISKTIKVYDGTIAGVQIAVLDAPAKGDYLMTSTGINLNSGTLTISCVSAANVMFYYR